MYDAVLASGAPGVSTNFGVMVDSDSDQQQNEEWAFVYTSVGPNSVDGLRTTVEEKIESLGIDRFAFYTLPIPRALTYLGGWLICIQYLYPNQAPIVHFFSNDFGVNT